MVDSLKSDFKDNWYLEENARQGIEERVHIHTVAIVVSPVGESSFQGSGSLIKVDKRFFIVTCKHVVKAKYKNENVGFSFKPDKGLINSTKKEIKELTLRKLSKISKSYFQRISIINRFYSDSEDDLVLLELDPSYGGIKNCEFYDITSRGILNPEMGKPLYLMGFSVELRRQIAKDSYSIFPYFLASALSSQRISCNDYKSKRHFLIDYAFDENSVDPHGLSGSGVWTRLPSGSNNIWTPNIYLAGIQTGILERSHLLKATKAERLLRLIEKLK